MVNYCAPDRFEDFRARRKEERERKKRKKGQNDEGRQKLRKVREESTRPLTDRETRRQGPVTFVTEREKERNIHAGNLLFRVRG